MNPLDKKPLWPVLAIGACGVLLLLACGLASILGAGSYLLTSRINRDSSAPKTALTPEKAQIESLNGWVEVQAQNGGWSQAEKGQVLSAGDHLRTSPLSSASLIFFDGSRASLKASSEIVIDELNAQKSGKQRVIALTQLSGESEHDVAPNKSQGSRYEVHTPSASGTAKGTKFSVLVNPGQTAYYYVTEGVVSVTGISITVEVNAGMFTTVPLNQPPLTPVMSVSGEGAVTQTGDQWIIGGQTFKVDDHTSIAGSPQLGDWVLVRGHLLDDGSAFADWIFLLHATPTNRFSLTGPVESTGETEWKVNGQAITVDENTDIADNLAVGDTVRVDGLVLPGGGFQATRIEKVDSQLGLPFNFTGIVQEINSTSGLISGVKILLNPQTKLAENLKAGDRVVVKGLIQANGDWLATSIQRADASTSGFEFTGTLQSKAPWKVAGIPFETRDWTEISPDLKIGDRVEVEGEIQSDGTWVASKVEKISQTSTSSMVIIGVVMGTEPWVVSGIPLQVTSATVITGEIKVGMLVRVELTLQADGKWQVVRIQPLAAQVWFPGCMDVIATVQSVQGSQIQLQNWPMLQMEAGAQVQGVMAPNSLVRIRICFGQDMTLKITYIVIVEQPQGENQGQNEGGEGDKVTVCHKPGGKKDGHTLTISRSALPAHLGHGDTIGACR